MSVGIIPVSGEQSVAEAVASLRLAPLAPDPAEYDLDDAAGTIGGVPHRWRWGLEAVDAAADLPGAALVALDAMCDVLAAAGGRGDDLTSLAEGVVARLRALSAEHGPRTRLVDLLGPGDPLTIATEEVDRMLSAAARAVVVEHRAPGRGEVVSVNVSDGGADKTPVDAVAVGPRGLEGDRQATRRHHGRPFQAVSLWSAEVIAELAAEGHPVRPGSAGENLTVAGLHWGSMQPGVRLAVELPATGGSDAASGAGGPSEEGALVLEVSSWAPPCSNVAGNFTDRDISRIDHDRSPGMARAYAWVLRPGRVGAGSVVVTF